MNYHQNLNRQGQFLGQNQFQNKVPVGDGFYSCRAKDDQQDIGEEEFDNLNEYNASKELQYSEPANLKMPFAQQIQQAYVQMLIVDKINSELLDVSKIVDKIKKKNQYECKSSHLGKTQMEQQSFNQVAGSLDQKQDKSNLQSLKNPLDQKSVQVRGGLNENVQAIIIEDSEEVKSQTQSNEIEDIDEQTFQEVKVHQINQPYKRIQPGAIEPNSNRSLSVGVRIQQSSGQNFNAQGQPQKSQKINNRNSFIIKKNESVYDDLANESPSVVDQGSAKESRLQKSIDKVANQSNQALLPNPFHLLVASKSQINKINQGLYHQRQGLNEHISILKSNSSKNGFNKSPNLSKHKNIVINPTKTVNNQSKPIKLGSGSSSSNPKLLIKKGLESNIIDNEIPQVKSNEKKQRMSDSEFKYGKRLRTEKSNQKIDLCRIQKQDATSPELKKDSQEFLGEPGRQILSEDRSDADQIIQSILKQLEQSQKQLSFKDKQMQLLNRHVREVLNQNSQLQLRLEMEQRNTQQLVRQLNNLGFYYPQIVNNRQKSQLFEQKRCIEKQQKLRANLSPHLLDGVNNNSGIFRNQSLIEFIQQQQNGSQNINLNLFEQQQQIKQSSYVQQPRKPSSKINQKLNQMDPFVENQFNVVAEVGFEVPIIGQNYEEYDADFVEDPD